MSSAKVQPFDRKLVSGAVTRAFAISILLHFAAIAGVELGHQLGWWNRSFVTALIRSDVVKQVAKAAEKRAQMQMPPEAELVFVDVDPSQAVTEPPKDPKFYSSQNTAAANRSRDQESNAPKIAGNQEKVARTSDVKRPEPRREPPPPPEKEAPAPKAETLQPTPAPPPQKTEPAPPAEQVKPAQPPPQEKAETLLAKVLPRDEPRPQAQPNNPPPVEQPRRRPRTVAEARAEKGLVGERMRQQGGVGRIGIEGLDVKATPFGAYDALFIEAVQSRWFSLLADRDFVGNQAGHVVVEFRLHQDGRITDLNVVTASVGEMLSWFCQRAVLDPAPYQRFPSDLRRTMDKDYREIRFTFYYNQ